MLKNTFFSILSASISILNGIHVIFFKLFKCIRREIIDIYFWFIRIKVPVAKFSTIRVFDI